MQGKARKACRIDPHLHAIKDADIDMKTKGPYLISVTATGK